MIFALNNNVTDVQGLDHKIFFKFYSQSKKHYYAAIRKFAHFISEINCYNYLQYSCFPVYLSKILKDGKLEFPQIESEKSYTLDEYIEAVKLYYNYLIENDYSHSVICAFDIIDRTVRFMLECFSLNYSIEFVDKLVYLLKENIKKYADNFLHFLYAICNILDKEDVKKMYFLRPKKMIIPEWAIKEFQEFEIERQENFLSESTLAFDRCAIYKLTSYLNSIGIQSYSDITAQHLINFHSQDIDHKTAAAKNTYNIRILNFLKFLARKKYIKSEVAYAMPTGAAHKSSPPEILTEEQIDILLNYFKNYNGDKTYYRNVAVLKIGLILGLRSSDIANLKFSNFDLENKILKIVQQKTLKELSLPISDSIINSIFLYIEKERPKVECEFIFLTMKSPYTKMNKGSIRRALTHIFGKNIVNPHMLRKTFASKLLNSGTNVNVISDALGHSGNQTVYKYLDTDERNMKKCPISLDKIEYIGKYL